MLAFLEVLIGIGDMGFLFVRRHEIVHHHQLTVDRDHFRLAGRAAWRLRIDKEFCGFPLSFLDADFRFFDLFDRQFWLAAEDCQPRGFDFPERRIAILRELQDLLRFGFGFCFGFRFGSGLSGGRIGLRQCRRCRERPNKDKRH